MKAGAGGSGCEMMTLDDDIELANHGVQSPRRREWFLLASTFISTTSTTHLGAKGKMKVFAVHTNIIRRNTRKDKKVM